MELLANHVAIAIENARLYGEVRDRLAEVTGLQAASTRAGRGAAARTRAARPRRSRRCRCRAPRPCRSSCCAPAGRELEVQVAVGEHAVELAAMRVAVDGSLPARPSDGRPQICARRSARPSRAHAAERPSAQPAGAAAARARPHARHAVGLYPPPERRSTPRQVELLATFANQAAISLDNARLYGELQSPTRRDGRPAAAGHAAARGARLRSRAAVDLPAAAAADRRRRRRPGAARGGPALPGDAHRRRSVGRRPARRAHSHRGLVRRRGAAHQSVAAQRRRPERPARLQARAWSWATRARSCRCR